MMKPTIALAALFLSVMSGHGKAYFYSRDELIQKAEVIAIIDLGEPEVPEADVENDPFAEPGKGRRGKDWNYRQCAKAKVVQVIKGKIEGEFTLYGGESFICAQCSLTEGRFLAFLSKDGKLWVGANWQSSLRPVSDGKIEWFGVGGEPYPMTLQAENAVLVQLRRVVSGEARGKAVEEKEK